MLVAGDEFSRTQHGNNNAYCQDNEISWLDWHNKDNELLDFTKRLIHLRKEHPIFCRRRWFQGLPIKGKDVTDIAWFLPEGEEMEDFHWDESYAKSLAVFLYGQGIRSKGRKGEVVKDDSFYLMFNAHHDTLPFKLPDERWGKQWIRLLDTNQDAIDSVEAIAQPGEVIQVAGRSMMMMQCPLSRD
jgi:glycogen operon protein